MLLPGTRINHRPWIKPKRRAVEDASPYKSPLGGRREMAGAASCAPTATAGRAAENGGRSKLRPYSHRREAVGKRQATPERHSAATNKEVYITKPPPGLPEAAGFI